MRDFRDAKAMAHTLRAALAAMDIKITVAQSLELIAKAFGSSDWNTLSALIRSQTAPTSASVAPPAPAPEGSETPDKPPGLLSKLLESTLKLAFTYARERRHEHVTVEHLLLLLLDDADASKVMTACGIDLGVLRKGLSDHLGKELQTPVANAGNPAPTLAFQRVLQRAVFHVQTEGSPPVKSVNVFVALFSEKQSRAVALLNAQGMTRLDAVNYITHGLTKGGGRAADGGHSQ